MTFEITPRLVESLGSEKYIYVDVPEENRAQTDPADRQEEERRADTIIARLINPDERSAGERITLSFDPARLHLFDAKTEIAIQ